MLHCMQTTSVRIDVDTHRELKRLAADLDVTVGEAVRVAVRRMHQEQIGVDLMTPPTDIDVDWLDADFG